MRRPLLHTRALAALSIGTLAAGACDRPGRPANPAEPSFQLAAFVITGMRGSGAIGLGEPTSAGGVNRQRFDLDVGVDNNVIYGRLDYIDSGFTKQDGTPPHFVAGPAWPGTAIVTFVPISATCVEFEGVGRLLNTNELLGFRVQTCDNGQPGVGLDVFMISVPQRLATDGQAYQRGPDMLSIGELILSGATTPEVVITRTAGDGALGDGAPLGEGVNRQVFQLDVGVENGIVAGTLVYTDSTVIMDDGLPATLAAGPNDAGTAFTSFVQVSNACVEFSGLGMVRNTGELLSFGGRACDAGPGQLDIFALWVPPHGYQRGPDMLSAGDLLATVVTPG